MIQQFLFICLFVWDRLQMVTRFMPMWYTTALSVTTAHQMSWLKNERRGDFSYSRGLWALLSYVVQIWAEWVPMMHREGYYSSMWYLWEEGTGLDRESFLWSSLPHILLLLKPSTLLCMLLHVSCWRTTWVCWSTSLTVPNQLKKPCCSFRLMRFRTSVQYFPLHVGTWQRSWIIWCKYGVHI